MSKNNIKFKYKNDSNDVVKIWLSAAPNTTHIKFNLTPIKTDHPFLGTIYYFEVPKRKI